MELVVKHFSELNAEELFEIYKLRVSVFVVEQKCPIRRWTMPIAPRTISGWRTAAGSRPMRGSCRRVCCSRRRRWGALSRSGGGAAGSRIVEAAVDAAKTKLHADTITIEAQTYARALYERCGFRQTSEEFLEDGIPHYKCS